MLSEDKNAEAKEKDGAFAGKAANKNGKRKEKKNGGRGFLGRDKPEIGVFLSVFSGFALLILLLLWLFQTCFLDTIYRRIKIAQMNSAVSQLAACSAEELESTLNQAAENGGLCIHVLIRRAGCWGPPVRARIALCESWAGGSWKCLPCARRKGRNIFFAV